MRTYGDSNIRFPRKAASLHSVSLLPELVPVRFTCSQRLQQSATGDLGLSNPDSRLGRGDDSSTEGKDVSSSVARASSGWAGLRNGPLY